MVKLIGFSSSAFKQKDDLKKPDSSNIYMAPEYLKGNYNEKCDIWSCGVILHVLLGGQAPFEGKDSNELLQSINKNEIKFKNGTLLHLSKEAHDLIKVIL